MPEGVDPAQKYGFGLWDAGALVAFADILRGYPRPDTASMGLLIVRGDLHRRGLGRRLHDQLAVTAEGWPEITTMRLGVIATAADSEPFWRALGYLPLPVPSFPSPPSLPK